jgi:hypothetical protein
MSDTTDDMEAGAALYEAYLERMEEMAIVRKQEPVKKLALIKKAGVPTGTPLSLPMSPNIPSEEMGAYSWLIYGTKKIGKTSLAAQFENAIFFQFEPGGKALRTYQVPCNRWEDAKGYLKLLKTTKHTFKTIVIDTGFEAYQKCFNFVCEDQNIEYPREENFGKDWKKIELEFRSFHNEASALGMGLIVLCHESLKESITRSGSKFDSVVPNLAKAADSYYRAIIDNVCWYHFRNSERFLLIKGSDYAMAGTAVAADNHFITTSGEQVHAVPMGKSAKEGYDRLAKAFRNEQKETYEKESQQFSEDLIKVSVHKKLRQKKA